MFGWYDPVGRRRLSGARISHRMQVDVDASATGGLIKWLRREALMVSEGKVKVAVRMVRAVAVCAQHEQRAGGRA